MRFKIGLSVMALATLAGLPVWAHHSFAAEYDADKPITIKGAVNHVEWVNPHSWVLVDVKDNAGKVTTWRCETAPPNILFRRGWTKNSLKEGEQVTVEGFMAKDGSATLSANSVTMASGKKMFSGSANDGSPKREEDSK
jgi:DNA/RNA endonuclease YhcR with UshA esterase domain